MKKNLYFAVCILANYSVKKVNRLQKDFYKCTYNMCKVCLILELTFQKAISHTYKLDNHLFNSFYFDNWFFMHHIFQSPPLAISNL